MLIIQFSLMAVSVSDRFFLYCFLNSLFCTFQNCFSIRSKEIVFFLLFGLRWVLETFLCHCLCCCSVKRQTVRHYWNAITLVCWCVCSSMKSYFTWVFHANKNFLIGQSTRLLLLLPIPINIHVIFARTESIPYDFLSLWQLNSAHNQLNIVYQQLAEQINGWWSFLCCWNYKSANFSLSLFVSFCVC